MSYSAGKRLQGPHIYKTVFKTVVVFDFKHMKAASFLYTFQMPLCIDSTQTETYVGPDPAHIWYACGPCGQQKGST